MAGSHAADTHRQVVAQVQMGLLSTHGETIPIFAELRYGTRDPYAVRATFSRPRHAPVVWVFARDLLLIGVARHAGCGDVQVYPDDDAILFELNSPEGFARLAAPTADIRHFVSQMLTLVAPGDEATFVDIDAELASLDPAIFAGDDAKKFR